MANIYVSNALNSDNFVFKKNIECKCQYMSEKYESMPNVSFDFMGLLNRLLSRSIIVVKSNVLWRLYVTLICTVGRLSCLSYDCVRSLPFFSCELIFDPFM